MEVIIYYLLCLMARKKIIVNVSYLMGTVIFISLSYNTANKLKTVPVGISFSSSNFSSTLIIKISPTNPLQYEKRLEYLRDKCGFKQNPSPPMVTNIIQRSDTLNHLGFVLRSQSLLYCSVPKVATRTLLNYITYLHVRDELVPALTMNSSLYFNSNSNLFRADYFQQILLSSTKNDSTALLSLFQSQLTEGVNSNTSQLDLWALFQNKALPNIRPRTLPDPSILISNSSTRVIFVRHPLERLASAYVDKIASLKAEPFSLYDSFRRSICRRYASSYLTVPEQQVYRGTYDVRTQFDDPCAKKIPTFEHFIEVILSGSSQVDVHWQPYSNLCQACSMKYNFIGKYETMQNDLQQLQIKLGLNSTEWKTKNHFTTGKSKEYYKLMYSKLSHRWICNLKDFYSEDLRLFDYQIEDYLTGEQKIMCPPTHYRRFRISSR